MPKKKKTVIIGLFSMNEGRCMIRSVQTENVTMMNVLIKG